MPCHIHIDRRFQRPLWQIPNEGVRPYGCSSLFYILSGAAYGSFAVFHLVAAQKGVSVLMALVHSAHRLVPLLFRLPVLLRLVVAWFAYFHNLSTQKNKFRHTVCLRRRRVSRKEHQPQTLMSCAAGGWHDFDIHGFESVICCWCEKILSFGYGIFEIIYLPLHSKMN